MAAVVDLAALRRLSLRRRAARRVCRIDSPVERYKRACLNWQLNPTPGTGAERIEALEALAEAREKLSVAQRSPRQPGERP